VFGYIIPAKSELKLREFEVYNAYYCGVCRSISERYGQIPRLLLTYDAAFLAMLLASISGLDDEIKEFRCPVHPARRRNLLKRRPEIDYAADVMLLLGYYKFADDRMDEHKFRGLVGTNVLKRAFKNVKATVPELAEKAAKHIEELNAVESDNESSIDKAEEPFALLLQDIFSWDALEETGGDPESDIARENWADSLKVACGRIGYAIGKWLYLIDAIDDLEKDIKKGTYNPLKYTDADPERLRLSLTFCLTEASEILELLPIRRNREIIENIVFVGLRAKQDEILAKLTGEEDERPV